MPNQTTEYYRGPEPDLYQQAGFSGRLLGDQDSPFSLLLLERTASSTNAPTIYLSAGIHGDEPAGVHAIDVMIREQRFSRDVHWLIFPCLNPTGYLTSTRNNIQDIDLNRDYLLQRSIETRLHAAWMREECPNIDLYLSLHEDWEAKGCYLYEINTHPKQTGFADSLLTTADPILPLDQGPVVDGHLLDAPGLIRHRPEPDEKEGWPEAIFVCKHKPILSYTFETPSTFPLFQRIQAHIAIIERCTQETLKSYSRDKIP